MTRVPFRGLEPYRYVDEPIFGGRQEQIDSLWMLVSRRRGCLLYGSSGAGKSSLVNAGLLPKLQQANVKVDRLRFQPIPGSEFVLEAIPTGDGENLLPSALRTSAANEAEVLSAAELSSRIEALPDLPRTLLIFDQFEEVVTLAESSADRDQGTLAQAAVVETLLEIYRADYTAAKLLFVFREDFLAQLDFFLDQCPDLSVHSLRVHPPATEHIEEILTKPFENGRQFALPPFSPDLSRALAKEFRAEALGNRLKLSEVQMACLELYLHENDRKELLARIGVPGLIEQHLRGKITALPKSDQRLAVSLLIALLTSVGTRNFLSVESLRLQPILAARHLDRLEVVLQQLVAANLLLVERRGGERMYEIVSEYLVPWIRTQRRAAEVESAWRNKRKKMWLIAAPALVVLILALGFRQWRMYRLKIEKKQESEQLANRGTQILAENNSPQMGNTQARADYVQTVLAQCTTEENKSATKVAQTIAKDLPALSPILPPSTSPSPLCTGTVEVATYNSLRDAKEIQDKLLGTQRDDLIRMTDDLTQLRKDLGTKSALAARLQGQCGDFCKDSVVYGRVFVYVDHSIRASLGSHFSLNGNFLAPLTLGKYFYVELPPRNRIEYVFSAATLGRDAVPEDLAIRVEENKDQGILLTTKFGHPGDVVMIALPLPDWKQAVEAQHGTPLIGTSGLICENLTYQEQLRQPRYSGSPAYPSSHMCGVQ